MKRINKLLPTLGLLFILSCGVFAQQRTWKTFSPNSGVWSILAPGIMSPDEAALESPSTMGSYSYSDANSFFSVIYRDTPKGRLLWKAMKKSHFNRVRDEYLKNNDGKLVKESEFSNGSMNGRDVYVKIAEGNVIGRESQIETKYRVHRLRMFFDDRRFYLLIAVLPEDSIDAPEINKYFNSFAIK